jgi:tryptophan synthase alpha chain
MMASGCTIVVERRGDGRFRATCHMLPDCEAVASTEEEARQAIERALEHHLHQRLEADANPIDDIFQRLRAQKRKAFIPFITAGDPDLVTTGRLVAKLADSGASLIEIGFPYSDPIADGPVIQASYTRALDKGIRLEQIFAWSRKVTGSPLVGMVSYSLVNRRGAEKFLDEAKGAGFAGLIVPDLPIDEAEALSRAAAERNVKLIHLVTPTTPPERAARIARLSTGFLYCVSITGITGERDRLPEQLLDQLRRLRQETDLPLCVGFGVSRPEHVQMLRDHVDGVIVGSAIVRRLEQLGSKSVDSIIDEIGGLAKSLVAALNP